MGGETVNGVFDIIGPVMIGPSSSHTAGAVRLGIMARKILGEEPVKATIGFHAVSYTHLAEMQAIRNACENLKTHDLSDCTIYTSCYPCPMCLSAIIWANIKTAYYGNTASDAANIGFRDDFIYNFIEDKCKDSTTLELKQLARSETIKAFELFQKKSDKTIY